MEHVEVGRLRTGDLYRFHQLIAVKREGERVVEDCEGDVYRLEAFGFNGVTRQEMVAVRCVDEGPDLDRYFFYSLAAFAGRFRPLPAAELAEPGRADVSPQEG